MTKPEQIPVAESNFQALMRVSGDSEMMNKSYSKAKDAFLFPINKINTLNQQNIFYTFYILIFFLFVSSNSVY